jgi:hypothetical protein
MMHVLSAGLDRYKPGLKRRAYDRLIYYRLGSDLFPNTWQPPVTLN